MVQLGRVPCSFEQVVARLQLNVQAQQSMCEFMTAEKTEKESALAFRLDRIPEGLTVLAGADVSKKRDTKLSVEAYQLKQG